MRAGGALTCKFRSQNPQVIFRQVLTSWCVIAMESCLPDRSRGHALAVRSETRPAMAR
jgi:hypothetical protein